MLEQFYLVYSGNGDAIDIPIGNLSDKISSSELIELRMKRNPARV